MLHYKLIFLIRLLENICKINIRTGNGFKLTIVGYKMRIPEA